MKHSVAVLALQFLCTLSTAFIPLGPMPTPTPTPTPTPMLTAINCTNNCTLSVPPTLTEKLELRELVVNQVGETLTASQYPTVTTNWFPTKLPNGLTTWIPQVYTQTFGGVPDQWPPPRSGSIGTERPTDEVKAEKTAAAAGTGPTAKVDWKTRMIQVAAVALMVVVAG